MPQIYLNAFCLVPPSCPEGFFGEICSYKCHCKDEAICNKDTGKCSTGPCAEGWGGDDCQQGLKS